MLTAFLAYTPAWLLGYLIVDAIWHAGGLRGTLLKLFIGLGVGLGAASLLLFAWLVVTHRLDGFTWILSAAILLGVALKTRRLRHQAAKLALPRPGAAPTWVAAALFLTFVATLALASSSVRMYSLMHPHGDRDAQAIWNLHARVIQRDVANWPEVFSSEFDTRFHADYPLLTPLNVAMGWSFLGSETTRAPMVLAALFALGMAGVLYAGLLDLKSWGQASLASMVLLGTPFFLLLATFQTADIPFAYFALATIVLLMLHGKHHTAGLLALAGLTAGLSAWTKNEGLLFIFACLIGVAGIGAGERQTWRSLRLFILGLAAPLLVIIFYKATLAPSNDLFMNFNAVEFLWKMASVQRYGIILASTAKGLFSIGSWPYSLPLILAVFCVIVGLQRNRGERKSALACGVILALQLIGYLCIYVITPLPLEFHLQYSLDRLLFQLFPASLFLVFWAVTTPEVVLPYQIRPAARPGGQYVADD